MIDRHLKCLADDADSKEVYTETRSTQLAITQFNQVSLLNIPLSEVGE